MPPTTEAPALVQAAKAVRDSLHKDLSARLAPLEERVRDAERAVRQGDADLVLRAATAAVKSLNETFDPALAALREEFSAAVAELRREAEARDRSRGEELAALKGAYEGMVTQLVEAVRSLPVPQVINQVNPAPVQNNIEVVPSEVRVEHPIQVNPTPVQNNIEVVPSEVRVEHPIQVNPTPVEVHNEVNPTPVVNQVAPTPVEVKSIVNVPPPRLVRKSINYNQQNMPVETVEEEIVEPGETKTEGGE